MAQTQKKNHKYTINMHHTSRALITHTYCILCIHLSIYRYLSMLYICGVSPIYHSGRKRTPPAIGFQPIFDGFRAAGWGDAAGQDRNGDGSTHTNHPGVSGATAPPPPGYLLNTYIYIYMLRRTRTSIFSYISSNSPRHVGALWPVRTYSPAAHLGPPPSPPPPPPPRTTL